MTQSNHKGVLVELTREDAEKLVADTHAAIGQLLTMISDNLDARPEFLRKLADLMEFKKRVKSATEEALK